LTVPLTSRQRQTLVWALVGALLVWALAALGPVLTPFVAAGILAYVLQPGVTWLSRHRVPRWLGATAVLLITLLTVVSIAPVFVPIVQTAVG